MSAELQAPAHPLAGDASAVLLPRRDRVAIAPKPMRFTARQKEVVQLLATGARDDEIAAALGISTRTARAHCDTLRAKLRVERRNQIPFAFGWQPALILTG